MWCNVMCCVMLDAVRCIYCSYYVSLYFFVFVLFVCLFLAWLIAGLLTQTGSSSEVTAL